jgi:hypothetical protein
MPFRLKIPESNDRSSAGPDGVKAEGPKFRSRRGSRLGGFILSESLRLKYGAPDTRVKR